MESEWKEHSIKELRDIVSAIGRIDRDMSLGLDIWALSGILQKLALIDEEKVFNESYIKILRTLIWIIMSIGELSSYIYKQNCQLAEQIDLSQERKNVSELNLQMENFIF